MSDSELYVGLISGTSADGIDAALIEFKQDKPQLLAHHSHAFTSEQKKNIRSLMLPGDNEIDRMGVLDQQLGIEFAKAAIELLKNSNIDATKIVAIGSHGQTIRHRPPGELAAAFTLQIGDPNVIAQQTGITTVADFRRRDMAASGQGAPLAPAFHNAVFRSAEQTRFIVNIGGIGNITYLPVDTDSSCTNTVIGFDTGPGNCLMDEWIQLHQQKHFDADGQWAAQGRVDNTLLQTLLQHPYFKKTAPKSTGREEFHLPWLQAILNSFPETKAVDVQTTLAELTAQTIANDIKKLALQQASEVFVCGGGAHNKYLLQRLSVALTPNRVSTTAELGISPDWVEAAAFAWMAQQAVNHKPGNLPSVTGANQEVILGGVYFA